MTMVLMLVAGMTLGMLVLMRARQIYRRDGHWAFLVTRTPWWDRRLTKVDLDGLPPAMRRWIGWAISEETPLRAVAVIASSRQSRIAPGRILSCRHVLAFPHGAVWRLHWAWLGLPAALSLSTEPTVQAVTTWRAGFVPIRRAGGLASQAMLSAQCATEAAVWTPAAFVSAPGVTMEEISPSRVAVGWEADGTGFRMEVEITPHGQPLLLTVEWGSMALMATPSGFEKHEGRLVARTITFEARPGSEPPPFSSARLETIRLVGPFIEHSHV